MSEKVVLPKFDLPGKQIHPAVKLMWTVGGLLLLSMVGLGGALYRHHSMEVAEENRKQAEIAAKTAQANAELEAAKARQAEADRVGRARESEGRGRDPGEERGRRRRRRGCADDGGCRSSPRWRPPRRGQEGFEDHRRQGRRG